MTRERANVSVDSNQLLADRRRFRLLISTLVAGIIALGGASIALAAGIKKEAASRSSDRELKKDKPKKHSTGSRLVRSVKPLPPNFIAGDTHFEEFNSDNEPMSDPFREIGFETDLEILETGCATYPDEPICDADIDEENFDQVSLAANCFYDGRNFGYDLQDCGECGALSVAEVVYFSEEVIASHQAHEGSVAEIIDRMGYTRNELDSIFEAYEACNKGCNDYCTDGCSEFDHSAVRPARCRGRLAEIQEELKKEGGF